MRTPFARIHKLKFTHNVTFLAPKHLFSFGTLRIYGKTCNQPEQVNQSLSRCGGGATLIASSMVVRPAATFIAALMRSGFIPSL
jgi:hypothetical protein